MKDDELVISYVTQDDVGKEVILDADYANGGPVKLISLQRIYATVEDLKSGKQWATMKNRLRPLLPEPEKSCFYPEEVEPGSNDWVMNEKYPYAWIAVGKISIYIKRFPGGVTVRAYERFNETDSKLDGFTVYEPEDKNENQR